jgi:hypothetical protein
MDERASRPVGNPPSTGSKRLETSAAARDIADRVLARGGAAASTDDSADAAEQTFAWVHARLSRWFGAYGAKALITRALVRAQEMHPALSSVTVSTTEAAPLTGFAASIRNHGEASVTAGIADVLAALVDLIGRLIGEDLAMSLFEQNRPAAATDGSEPPPRAGDQTHSASRAPDEVSQTMKADD